MYLCFVIKEFENVALQLQDNRLSIEKEFR